MKDRVLVTMQHFYRNSFSRIPLRKRLEVKLLMKCQEKSILKNWLILKKG